MSISHWSDPLSDRIVHEWFENKINAYRMLQLWDIHIHNTDIEDFVRARNGITHGRVIDIDQKIAHTAIAMISLIYCLALRRLGAVDVLKGGLMLIG